MESSTEEAGTAFTSFGAVTIQKYIKPRTIYELPDKNDLSKQRQLYGLAKAS